MTTFLCFLGMGLMFLSFIFSAKGKFVLGWVFLIIGELVAFFGYAPVLFPSLLKLTH